MRLLVTGATGLLGGAVARSALAAGHDVVGTVHHAAGDGRGPWRGLEVTDADSVAAAVAGVDAVVHTAYARPGHRSRDVNVTGSLHVAAACAAAGIGLVHVSSDVVFGGRPPRPEGYREGDRIGPVAGFAYGEEKADAERGVAAACPGTCIVRPSLMYDLAGGSSAEALVVAGADGSVAHFTDEHRCPAHVDDVAGAITALLGIPPARRPAVVHLGGPERLSRHDIALRLATHLGIDPGSVRPGSSADVPGERPADLTLDSSLARDVLGWRPRPLRARGAVRTAAARRGPAAGRRRRGRTPG
jgi:dTDP-4-dehydrorhamnose reductase